VPVPVPVQPPPPAENAAAGQWVDVGVSYNQRYRRTGVNHREPQEYADELGWHGACKA